MKETDSFEGRCDPSVPIYRNKDGVSIICTPLPGAASAPEGWSVVIDSTPVPFRPIAAPSAPTTTSIVVSPTPIITVGWVVVLILIAMVLAIGVTAFLNRRRRKPKRDDDDEGGGGGAEPDEAPPTRPGGSGRPPWPISGADRAASDP